MSTAKKFACFAVTPAIVQYLQKMDNVVLYRMIQSSAEENLSCPIFPITSAYYEEVSILDDKIMKFIQTFPGVKHVVNI